MLFSLSLLWSTSQLTVRAEELLSNTLFALIFARTNFRAFSRRIVSSPSLALFPGRVFDNHICRWGHVIGKLAYRFPHWHVVWPTTAHVRLLPYIPQSDRVGPFPALIFPNCVSAPSLIPMNHSILGLSQSKTNFLPTLVLRAYAWPWSFSF